MEKGKIFLEKYGRLCAVALSLVSGFMIIASMICKGPANKTIMVFGLAMLLTLMALCFFCCNVLNGNKRYLARFHAIAIHLVLSILWIIYDNQDCFVYTLLHALLCGGIGFCLVYVISNNNLILSIIAFAILVVLGLFQKHETISILELIGSLSLLMISFKDIRKMNRRIAIFVAIVVLFGNVAAQFSDYETAHRYMHLMINCCAFCSVAIIYKLTDKKA